jgi:hypothetical protein
VVIQTRDGEALMDANIPTLLDCGQYRHNLAAETDVRRTGTQYAVGYRLNATGTGIQLHPHSDSDGERANTHERQIRRAGSDIVAVMSKLSSLRPIFKKTGADLEGLCGKLRARQITMGSVADIHSECLASCGGYASAPTRHTVWRNFEVASWGERHSDTCNVRHAPPGQSSTTYIINNNNSSSSSCSSANELAVPINSNSSSSDAASAGDATAATAHSGCDAGSASDSAAAAAAASDDSSGNGDAAAAAASDNSSDTGDGVAASDNGATDANESAAAAAAAAANSNNAAAASSDSTESAAAAAPSKDSTAGGSSSSGGGSGSSSSSNSCATSNCVETPRACLEAGGQFFIGNCRVKLGHGVTIMYRYVQTTTV